jgi:hypothetical protein
VFRCEKYPLDWARGLIFPLFKGGSADDRYNPLKYRGITLLSVVGKIYASVLNERVTCWIETSGILVEEQAGFRKNRSVVDQLFILTETIRNRKPKKTYCCFIDIQKAYDKVWREGLWEKLAGYGISGKMWRVLRSIYESVESSVLLGGKNTRFFKIDVGLRQGCVLSPILFAIFINGLAEEINQQKLGAKLTLSKDGRLGILMFADDIALIAEDRQKLERLLEVTFQYSKRWRFSFNYDKCAVVIFESNPKEIALGTCTTECTCGHHWKLGKKLIKEVASYKYLGVELDQKLSFREFKKRIGEKARRNITKIWRMGMSSGMLSVKASINLYESLVRSVWGRNLGR